MTTPNTEEEAARFLRFHQVLFRAQAYNRAFFLEDLAEDFLLAELNDATATPDDIGDVDEFLKAYTRWEKTHFDDTKAG